MASRYQCRVFPSGRTGGDPLPLPEKLACPPVSTPTVLPKNVDPVIFMHLLTILPKLSLVGALVEPKWKTL